MNRGSRDSSSVMQSSLQHRRGRSLGSVVKERDDDLALFHEMRKREKERNSLLLPNSDEFEPPLAASKSGSSPIYKITASTPARKGGSDDLLNADGDKNDYDWLLTPPGTPLFPSLEMERQPSCMGQRGTPAPTVRPPPALKSSRLSNSQTEPSSKVVRGSLTSRQVNTSSALSNSTNTTTRRSSMSTSAAQASSRPSTPTLRSMAPAPRSGLTASRPSTPTSRSAIPASRPSSRPSTPTRRPSTPTPIASQNNSAPPTRSSSVGKASSMPTRNSVPSRGSSPTVKSRPWQPTAMPGFSLDAPPNLRTTMPERPVSATRGRPGAPSIAARATIEAPSATRPRRQSCSPSVTRGRISTDSHNSGSSSVQTSKFHSNGNGTTTAPVVVGSKMVEKLMNARRSAPQRQEEQAPTRPATSTVQTKRPGKSVSSQDSTGFGRTLSKKSLDMALRHMDIRRSTPSSLRPLMTNIPTASLYSVRSGAATRSRPASISDSPIATSSNASSEHSASVALGPEGSELDDDDFGSEIGSRTSPASQQGSVHSKGELGSTNWLHSPEFREDKYDRTFLFNKGFERLSEKLEGVGSTACVRAEYDRKLGLEY